MPKLDDHLKISRCPHCSIDHPNLALTVPEFVTRADNGMNQRYWKVYACRRCGGVVTAYCYDGDRTVIQFYPSIETVDDTLPERVKAYLQQAIESSFAPAGSVMLCASAVDAMLKEKGFSEGSLYTRINNAVKSGLLTKEMGTWAHQVRLDANGQRHSDGDITLPTIEDAKQSIEFATTLAEFLFILPSKVTHGIQVTSKEQTD